MKKQTRIAFDSSAFLWHSMLAGKDIENGFKATHKGKECWINSRHHGYDICLQAMLDVLDQYKLTPVDMIMVFEGKNSKSKRLMIDSTYKQGREHPEESYAEFMAARDAIRTTFLELGAQAMTQDYAEGDDTLAWLAENTEDDLVIATFDNDISALNGTNAYGANILVWVNGQDGGNKYGMFDHHLITTYKALVGDSSDGIKGCIGFGPAKFEAFIERYGFDGLQQLHDMLKVSDLSPIAGLDVKADPLLCMISEQAPQVLKSFDLARLRPDWVNTKAYPIEWQAGMVRQLRPDDYDPRLKRWYGVARLVTASSFKAACAWALPLIKEGREVALDIESSQPDESDEWLLRQGKEDGVDVFGHKLAGMGLTFGRNNQYTLYFSVDHADTDNIASEDLRQLVAQIPQEIEIIIQNVLFELPVLFNEWGDKQLDNGYHGFLPNVRDTAFEASYVDENNKRGLKERSLRYLGYRQQTYEETTVLTAAPADLPRGGKWVKETYKTEWVSTGKFVQEHLLDAAGVQVLNDLNEPMFVKGPEILQEQFVLVGTGQFEEVPVMKRGVQVGVDRQEIMERVVDTETRRYKMNELSADHVFGYGADDPICTIALHNFYKLNMQLEHHYHVYEMVELKAAYQHAKNFVDGVPFSVETMNKLVAEDDATYDTAWAIVRSYLIKKGWEGTQPPRYTADITAAETKDAFTIVTGRKMDTQMRTVSKLAIFARETEGEGQFGDLLAQMITDKTEHAVKLFNDYVLSFFKGEPDFNDGSPKQMQHLMYDVMGLTVKVRNKATDTMRAAGIYEGSPKTDVLAIAYALRDCDAESEKALAQGDEVRSAAWLEVKAVLEAMKLVAMVGTRRSLYYSKYPPAMHWKDGRIRSSHNQAATNTRRASESGPNKQQMAKAAKIDGQEAKFRSCIVPHRPDAVVVSMDFAAQELRIIADYSRDPNMLACYVGDDLKDQHAMVGLSIMRREKEYADWTYDQFVAVLHDANHPLHKVVKAFRSLGKKVGFTTEYGAMAPKLAATLLCEESTAQEYIDAKEDTFCVAADWKVDVTKEAKQKGYVLSKLGAVRHLREAFAGDKWEASKAERQAVNYKIQGSAAEMTKLAEGRMWESNLFFDFDAVCYGPVHDEVFASVRIVDLPTFLPKMHACMTAPYADMSVPIASSISFGKDFYHQIEIGEVPTKEAIEKGLAQMAGTV